MQSRSAPQLTAQPWFRLRVAACLLCALGFFLCVKNAVPHAPQRIASPVPDAGAPAIIIDPGHGGKDPGRVSGTEYEKHWALKVSLALADELRRRGYPVELTRTDDSYPELVERAAFSNSRERLAFVSIHFNASESDASGIETYFAWPREPETMARLALRHNAPPDRQIMDGRSRQLAERVQASVTAATGARDRGVLNNTSHAVTRRTEAPSILVECGFLTNAAELALIQTDEDRARLVQGLADGIHGWIASGAGADTIQFEPIAPAADPTPELLENP